MSNSAGMPTGMSLADAICELFKLLRARWLTRREIAESLGLSLATAYRWVKALTEHGILREAKGVKPNKRIGGRAPRVFSLAPEWGGEA